MMCQMDPLMNRIPACVINQDGLNGLTLVIYKIVLNACGKRSCTPRTFSLRITGPSYPAGETFSITAGSCTSLDEPLILTGLMPGDYCIDEIQTEPIHYISTFTGPTVCRNVVRVAPGCPPAVVTIVNRERLCRLCRGHGCGCDFCTACNGGCSSVCSGSSRCARSTCRCGRNCACRETCGCSCGCNNVTQSCGCNRCRPCR